MHHHEHTEHIQQNRRKLVTAISGAAALSLLGCTNAPITGRQQFMIMSESDEMQMGLMAFSQVKKEEKISKNPAHNRLITNVGKRIAAVANRPDFNWEFLCFESEQVNAFCLPGGKVGIYTGLLPITQNEAGLAAVVGHEVGHAIARHGAERYSQNFASQGLMVGLSIFLGNKTSANNANSVMAAVGLGLQVGVLLPFSRTHESEADHIGLVLMAKAGYNPREAVEVWKRMKAKGGNKPPEFLSTHPSDDTRIRNLERLMPEAMKYYRG